MLDPYNNTLPKDSVRNFQSLDGRADVVDADDVGVRDAGDAGAQGSARQWPPRGSDQLYDAVLLLARGELELALRRVAAVGVDEHGVRDARVDVGDVSARGDKDKVLAAYPAAAPGHCHELQKPTKTLKAKKPGGRGPQGKDAGRSGIAARADVRRGG